MLIRLPYILEPFGGLFIIRVFIGMMNDGELPICLFDFILPRIFAHAENLIVIFAFTLLEFQLGLTDLSVQFVGRMRLGDRLVFSNRFFPVPTLP